MAVVISNRGRLISDLTQAGTLGAADLLIIQSVNASTNATRKTTLADVKSYVLGTLDGYAGVINFQNVGNKFTGAFYNPTSATADLYTVTIRSGGSLTMGSGTTATISPNNLTFAPLNGSSFQTKIVNTSGGITGSASTGLTGSLKGKLTGNVIGNVTGNVIGNLTGNVTGNITGNVVGNLTGNTLGNLTGDILNANSNKILENGSGAATSNGGYPNAFFYGTSSYSGQALTAAYAATGGAGGLPGGGSQYQVVTKDGGGGVTWSTPITRSGAPAANYVSYWTDSKTLAASSMTFYSGTNTLQVTNLSVTGKVTGNSGITGSFYGVGFKTLNGQSISFWGTGSHAVSASYLSSNVPNPLGILTQTSPNTADTYKGTSYTYAHSLTATPYYFRPVLICVTNDTTAGYVVNDEIEAVAIYDSSSNNEHTAITSWSNPTYLGASCLNNGWLVNNKSNGTGVTLDPTKWKIKFYYK